MLVFAINLPIHINGLKLGSLHVVIFYKKRKEIVIVPLWGCQLTCHYLSLSLPYGFNPV